MIEGQRERPASMGVSSQPNQVRLDITIGSERVARVHYTPEQAVELASLLLKHARNAATS